MNANQQEEIKTTIATVTVYKKEGYAVHNCYSKRHDDIIEMQSYIDDCDILLSKYAPIATLMDIRKVKGSTKEVRDLINTSETTKKNTLCAAILLSSGVPKIIGNLFLRFSKPDYPTRLFRSKEKAIKWLQEQTQIHKASKGKA